MQVQSSLKALAGAVLNRTIQRTLSAQYKKEPAQYPHIAQKIDNSTEANSHLKSLQIEMIRAWLHRIGEPVEDHHIVIDKCKADPEAMAYFLKHVSSK